MKAKLILACGWLANLYEESKIETDMHRDLLEEQTGADFTDTIIMVKEGTESVPLPDPEKDPADWDELRHVLKSLAELTLVYVVSQDGPMYLVFRGEVAFSVCKSGPETWMPMIVEALGKLRDDARAEFTKLMDRVVK